MSANGTHAVPGFHVLIVGVSNYRHLPKEPSDNVGPPGFGLAKLPGAALSAFRLRKALLSQRKVLGQPLRSCRILLSPTPAEVKVEKGLAPFAKDKSRQASAKNVEAALRAWRTEAIKGQNSDACTLVYFAGHGVQCQDADTALLCDDFGDPDAWEEGNDLLQASISRRQVQRGLWKLEPQVVVVPDTQFCFFDACRTPIDDLLGHRPRSIFSLALRPKAPKYAVTLHSTAEGHEAWGLANRFTVFGEALRLALLHGGDHVTIGGQAGWFLNADSLNQSLNAILRIHPDLRPFGQIHQMDGPLPPEAILLKLKSPPKVVVRFSVQPASDRRLARLELARSQPPPRVTRLGPPIPAERLIPAGRYAVTKFCPAGAAQAIAEEETILHALTVLDLRCPSCHS
jgi:hypothetical protein